jgi:lambda family phage portal protein
VKKAQLNLIDKAVAFLNPQGAVNRMIARQKLVNFSYDAVKYTRERKGPSALSGAEDYHSNYDRVELMKRARDLAENVGLVRSILMKFASHTAANISYQARTENPEVNTEVEAYWAEWFDKCDITTRHTGSTLMQVAMMSMLRDGDFLFCLVRDKDGNLKIQGIEADRLGDPFKVYTSLDLIGGIHIDRDTGAPSAYDIYNRSIGDFYTYQTTIPSSQAFHLFDPLRIDQYRGISAFHTAINDATDIYDIINFEKMAAKNASSQAGIVKRNNNNASDLSSLTNDEDLNGNTIKLEAIESGKISYLEPGEDIVFPDGPSRPSGAFAEFHKILLRNICLGLGIPYSFAVDPSAMSGPTARLEMQQAGRTFRRYQKLLDDKVLRPIKNIVIADGVARGLIENNVGSRTARGIFNFGANVSIDLGRESASAISEFKTGLRTAADIYAERGQDFESSMRQRAIEAKLIKDLSEKYGVDPETISDIVPPKPTQTKPEAPSVNPIIPAKDSPESDEDIGGDQKPIPEDPVDGDGQEVGLDCGTGAGGFKEGNTCSSGGGAGGQDSEPKERYRDRIEGTDEEVRNEERKRERKLKNLKQKVVESKQREADIRKQISDLNQKIASKTTDYDAKIAAIDKVAEEMIQESKQRQVKIQEDLDKKLAAIAEKSKKRQEAIVEKYKKRKEEREAKRSVVSTKRSSSLEKNFEEGDEIESDEKIESEISNAEKNNDKLNSLVSELKAILEEIGNEEAKKKVLESLDPASIKMLIQGMMGGIELAKYDGIDFTPPEGAREAAKRALDVREGKPASQRGMTPVGIARARDLINGVKMSPDTVRRMKAFFDRHEVDKKGATWDEQGKGWQAWNGWGGDAGYAWARKVVGQMEARDKKTEFVAGRDCGQDEGGTFGPDNKCAVGYGRPPLKGGYTPTRPGGKFPKDYKRPTIQKQKEQPPKSPEKSKKEIPSSDKIKKGTAQSQAPDAKAVEWAKTIKSDKNDKKLFEDFTGSRFREINTNPEGQEGQRIISLINKQSSQTQKTDMYRGLSLKSEEDANRFFEGLRGGQTTNRTLTSFTPDPNQAAFFSFAKTKEPVSVFMTLKSSKNLKALQGVSVESFEEEFVLTRGKRLRLIGEPRRKKNTLEFEIDVEEY